LKNFNFILKGWRKHMEDAHITIPNLREDPSVTEKVSSVFQSVNDNYCKDENPMPTISLFGVFDGHGGDAF
jgi:serine/threonine protein phosphatase PrpC